jgi:hypothetical protein
MTAGIRLLILADHQHAGLAAAFRALYPDAHIADFDLARLATDANARAAASAALADADHIISYDAPAALGPFATAALRASRRPFHLLPSFRFAGFHPDSVTITLDGARLAGPTGGTHSRLAAAAYLAGLSVPETMDLFNSLVFARIGYFAAFAEQRAALLQLYAAYGYDLAPQFDAWRKSGCFMLDPTHPRMRVLLDLARLLAARCGLPPPVTDIAEYDVPNPLATVPTHPLLPEIAARIGVSPEGTYRGPARLGGKPTIYSLDAFLTASFQAFRRAPLAALHAAPGIDIVRRTLNLPEADFGRAAATASAIAAPPADVVFLTWHGRLLATETATALVIQTDAWPSDPDSTPAAVRATLPIDAPITTTLAGGTDIAPGTTPGSVTIGQGATRLSAPPHRFSLRFEPPSGSEAQLFLPLRRGDLATLRTLAGGAWRLAPDGTELTGAGIRLRPGFVLAIAAHRIDLATARFTHETPPDTPARITIHTPAGDITLVADPSRTAADAFAVDAAADLGRLPEAASAEQFRLACGHRLHIQGPPEMIHLPLALDNADRAWLHTALYSRNALQLGNHPFHATPTRASDKFVLLGRGSEGIIVDRHGTWTPAGFLGPKNLPPGLHAEGDAILVDRAAAAAAPKIPGPACVFYNPNLQNWYHWLVEAAVSLHVLAPFLPPQTSLLLPPTLAALRQETGIDHMALIAALGFAGMPMHHAAAPLVNAADLTWLENAHVSIMPATLLRSFRDRVHTLRPPGAAHRRLYVKRRHLRRVVNNILVESFLVQNGFTPIFAEELSATQQIDLFAAADFVVAVHGAGLSNLLFCQPGTRVLELTPDTEFRPFFWHISEKLGLLHAVLPCPTGSNSFNGHLNVAPDRFRGLFKMLSLMET